MTISMAIDQTTEKDAESAFQIALGFLRAKGEIADEAQTSVFVAASIMRRVRNGERHKILLANHAIGDYEARFLVEPMAD